MDYLIYSLLYTLLPLYMNCYKISQTQKYFLQQPQAYQFTQRICFKVGFIITVKQFFMLRLFPHHPRGKSHWRIVFLAATAAQEAHQSLRSYGPNLCFQRYFALCNSAMCIVQEQCGNVAMWQYALCKMHFARCTLQDALCKMHFAR